MAEKGFPSSWYILYFVITLAWIYLAYILYRKLYGKCKNGQCESETDYPTMRSSLNKRLTVDPYDPRILVESEPAKVRFLTKEETREFILEDTDNYAASLTPPDLCARHVGTVPEYIEKSADETMDFSIFQKNTLLSALSEADQFFSTTMCGFGINRQKILDLGWTFALTKGKIYENGLPHTRAELIFLTPEILRKPLKDLVGTLIHEKIHVYQRTYYADVNSFLLQDGFKVAFSRLQVPRVRANPDTDGMIYLNPDKQIYAALYNSDCPSSISDVTVLPEPGNHNEHPYEWMAYQIAQKYEQK
jgi:hypothetical protein